MSDLHGFDYTLKPGLRLSANISWIFTEHESLIDRINAARNVGFKAVECLFPYAISAHIFRGALDDAGIKCVLINTPVADWASGGRGYAALDGRGEEFRDGIRKAIEYALTIGCPRIHVMSGIADSADATSWQRCRENLAFAAESAKRAGIVAVIEAVNQVDMPGYFLRTTEEAAAMVAAVDHPGLRLQLDLYHHAMEGSEPAAALRTHAVVIEHVQIAGYPGRQEPDRGELALEEIGAALSEIAYSGWIGCEYRPAAGTIAGLGWTERLAPTTQHPTK